jgi:hypothetical protein
VGRLLPKVGRHAPYRKVRGRWYYKDGGFFHMHAGAIRGQRDAAPGWWKTFYPVKDNYFGAYCSICHKTMPDEAQALHDLQVLKGKV